MEKAERQSYNLRQLSFFPVICLAAAIFSFYLYRDTSSLQELDTYDRLVIANAFIVLFMGVFGVVNCIFNPQRIRVDDEGIHYKTSTWPFEKRKWTSYLWQDIDLYHFAFDDNYYSSSKIISHSDLIITLKSSQKGTIGDEDDGLTRTICLDPFFYRKRNMRKALVYFGGKYCYEDIAKSKKIFRHNCLMRVAIILFVIIALIIYSKIA